MDNLANSKNLEEMLHVKTRNPKMDNLANSKNLEEMLDNDQNFTFWN